MSHTIQTTFKRIETKYIFPEEHYEELLADLKSYLEEDNFSVSTIRNIYFDTADFDLITDALAGKHLRDKIRLRSYLPNITPSSQAFLEIKQKDSQGIGHKHRLVASAGAISRLLTTGKSSREMTNQDLIDNIHHLQQRHGHLIPRVYIGYERYSLKQRANVTDKVRITFDTNLRYCSQIRNLAPLGTPEPLLEPGQIIMEIKAGEQKPAWLQRILDRHGLVQMKFSKYAAAYHATEGLAYAPRPALLTESEVTHA